jgi:hypothetical protein
MYMVGRFCQKAGQNLKTHILTLKLVLMELVEWLQW